MSGIVLVGGGNMGSAMLQSWLADSDLCHRGLYVVDPRPLNLANAAFKETRCYASCKELPSNLAPDAIIFAVKPQAMREVIHAYRKYAASSLFLSVAAGFSLKSIQEALGNAAIARAMPNLCAIIGKSVTVTCSNEYVKPNQQELISNLLLAIGSVHFVKNEDILDKVTAISGSGPAYLFYFVECVTQAAINLGLDQELAHRLVTQTTTGAALLCSGVNTVPRKLRESVTSPNGTTEAAMQILTDMNGFESMLKRAVQAAATRAQELSR